MAELAVAERLSKTLSQLRETMTAEELLLWMLYFDVKQDREQEALEKAKNQHLGVGRLKASDDARCKPRLILSPMS